MVRVRIGRGCRACTCAEADFVTSLPNLFTQPTQRPSTSPSISPASSNRFYLLDETPSTVSSPAASPVSSSRVASPVAPSPTMAAATHNNTTFKRIPLPRNIVVSSRPEAQEIATIDYAIEEATIYRNKLIEAGDEAKKSYRERVKVPYHPSHLVGPPLDADSPRCSTTVVTTTNEAPATQRLPDGPLRSGWTAPRGKRGGVKARASAPAPAPSFPKPRPTATPSAVHPIATTSGTRPPEPRSPGQTAAPRHDYGPPHGYSSPAYGYPPYGYGYGYQQGYPSTPASAPPPMPLYARMQPPRYSDVASWPVVGRSAGPRDVEQRPCDFSDDDGHGSYDGGEGRRGGGERGRGGGGR